MFGSVLETYVDIATTFVQDYFSADIKAAEFEVQQAQAALRRLKERRAAIEKMMASLKASQKKEREQSEKQQKKWNKKMRNNAKRMAEQFGDGPLVTGPYPFPPSPPIKAKKDS